MKKLLGRVVSLLAWGEEVPDLVDFMRYSIDGRSVSILVLYFNFKTSFVFAFSVPDSTWYWT